MMLVSPLMDWEMVCRDKLVFQYFALANGIYNNMLLLIRRFI